MRGEHHAARDERLPVHESSPHARGTLTLNVGDAEPSRIIPACAGNTTRRRSLPTSATNHPRMRGEHELRIFATAAVPESSPHARGTRHARHRPRRHRRIIPACAGNTSEMRRVQHERPNHPRMRGEHFRSKVNPFAASESSPHARGTRTTTRRASLMDRIIPACAGNTQTCALVWHAYANHPRMRGEHAMPPATS